MNLKDIGKKTREDVEKLNEAYSNVFEGDRDRSYTDFSKQYSPRTLDIPSPEPKKDIPFTNAQIKTTLQTTKEKLRDTLDREILEELA